MKKKLEMGFKAWVSLDAIKGDKSMAQISSDTGFTPTRWVGLRSGDSRFFSLYFLTGGREKAKKSRQRMMIFLGR